MRNSLQFATAERARKALAIFLAVVIYGGVGRADTVVIAGNPIVTTPPIIAIPGPPVKPPQPVYPQITGTFVTVGPTIPNSWVVSGDSRSDLTITTDGVALLRGPVATMVLPVSVGSYDSFVGDQMGCTRYYAVSEGTPTAHIITCPLVSKLRPEFRDGAMSCLQPAPDAYTRAKKLPVAADSICLLDDPAQYSRDHFQCFYDHLSILDPVSRTYHYVPYCDAATIKFPVSLENSKHNRSGDVLKDWFNITLHDADNKLGINFSATYTSAAAITNPEEIGWLKTPKPPSHKTCDEGHHLSFGMLLGGCTDSKGVQLAQTIAVGVAVLVVGAFAGPALGGVAAADGILATSPARFLVLAAEDAPTPILDPALI